MTTTTRIPTADQGALDAYLSFPQSGSGPGIVVLQEIFGVNDYVKGAADRLAQIGYVACAPGLFWRIEPGATMEHNETGLKRAITFAQRLDHQKATEDAISTLSSLQQLPQVTAPRAALLGLCLGGTLAFAAAIHGDPAAAVCYYGSGIADLLAEADRVTCPVLLHFGGKDQYIPREQIDRVAAYAETRENFECHIHEDAGHAFDNPSPMFHHAAAAAEAWQITAAFLKRHLGGH